MYSGHDLTYEKTKEKELKKVKQVFRNKTNEWLHLKVLNEKTQKEENITCTKNHRIYIKNKGWIEAKDILENDIVLMYNNIQGKVISKELQVLDHFEITYNFEVEDNHNYYVGVECILVHNDCDGSNVVDVQECSKGKVPNANSLGQKHHAIGRKPFRLLEKTPWKKIK